MPAVPAFRSATILLFATVFALAGCAGKDTRLTDDQQSCRSMGHQVGSTAFDLCMKDLNERRCADVSRKGSTNRQVTLGCTRL